MIRFKILIMIIISFLILACSRNRSIQNPNINFSETFNKIFFIEDSLVINYPVISTPKFIRDLCINDDFIYILGSNKSYPLVKFNRNGKFIKNICKSGNGPNEFNYFIHKIAININGDIIAKTLSFNQLYLIKNDSIFLKKTLGEFSPISDIGWIDNNRILCTGYGRGKWHYLIFNKNLELIDTLIHLNNTSIVPNGYIENFALIIQGNKILSHHLYPAKLYLCENQSGKLIKEREIFFQNCLSNYKKVDFRSLIKNYNEGRYNLANLLFSFPKIMWISKYDDIIVGIYYAARKIPLKNNRTNKEFYVFMINLEKNKAKDFKLEENDIVNLICYEGGFVKTKYEKIKDKIIFKLYFLKLKNNIKNYLDCNL